MGMSGGYKNRQQRAIDLRDMVEKVNALTSSLEEEGYTVTFKGVGHRIIVGKLVVDSVTRLSKL